MPTFTVQHGGQARSTPAFGFLAEAWGALVKAENTPDLCGIPPYNAQSEVLYATSAGPDDIVGVLAFSKSSGVVTVELLWVEPTARRLGAARALWFELVSRQPAGTKVVFPIEGDNRVAEDFVAAMGASCVRVAYEAVV